MKYRVKRLRGSLFGNCKLSDYGLNELKPEIAIWQATGMVINILGIFIYKEV